MRERSVTTPTSLPSDDSFDSTVRGSGPFRNWVVEPEPVYRAPVPERHKSRVWLHVALFVLTLVSTTLVGAAHYASFVSDFGTKPVLQTSRLILNGLPYSLTIIAILGAHEMGHYLACRYYRINATLPFFLPMPLVLTGTLGAVIKIRQPILYKAPLFDVGIAGPIAGFLVAVPALICGLALSNTLPLPKNFVGASLGEPLIFKAVAWLVWGPLPTGLDINLHPVGLAAWFGLLVTALNLFPIAQLDGGHISYAVFGRHSTRITLGATLIVASLVFVSLSWLVWTMLLVAMLVFVGPRHPAVLDEDTPLDSTRLILAVFALIMFLVCFTPAPIQVMDLIRPN
jgi:membrane-associated protease RseP (regulator of RpoE activity)